MDVLQADKLIKISELNDTLRSQFKGGKVMLSEGVAALPDMVKAAALQFMAQYHDFTPANDPHGEHDFGAFELCNRRFFWKVDYYDKNEEFGSKDPTDPENTMRVLTLILAEEY